MSIRSTLLASAAVTGLAATPALSQSLRDQLIAGYQTQGYDFIEVKTGPTQIKIEATRGNQTLEVIYDASTGEILSQEVGRAEAEDQGRTGVELDTRNEDFLGDGGGDDADDHAEDAGDDADDHAADAGDDADDDEEEDNENDDDGEEDDDD